MKEESRPLTQTADSVLSSIVIKLLKGVIYQEDDATRWNDLLNLQGRIRDTTSVLGLELMIDEAEGYAYLRSKQTDEEEEDALPRLMTRRPLSFPVSLLLALLRKRLVEFDTAGEETRLVLSIEEIAELVRVFFADSTNEAKLIDQLEANINRIVDLGFLRRLKSTPDRVFEVRRIIKAFIDAQWLNEFDLRLAEYREKAGLEKSEDDGRTGS